MRILGILIMIAGVILFCQNQVLPALISILIGAVFAAIPKKSVPIEEETSDEENSEVVRVDTPLKKVRQPRTDIFRIKKSNKSVPVMLCDTVFSIPQCHFPECS